MDLQSALAVAARVPFELIAAVAFVGLVAFDAYRSGTGRATALALSLPISTALYAMLTDTVGFASVAHYFESAPVQVGAFVVLFAAIFFLTHRMLAASFGIPSPFMLAILAGAAALLVLAVTLVQLPALATLLHVSTFTTMVFGAPYRLFWIIAAYLTLAFVRS